MLQVQASMLHRFVTVFQKDEENISPSSRKQFISFGAKKSIYTFYKLRR